MLDRMRVSTVVLVVFLCAVPLQAEEPVVDQVEHAYQLWDSGQARAAIAVLEPMLRSGAKFADSRTLGVAWNVLGSSYLDMERYEEARRAYQHAIELFQPLPEARVQYASAVNNLGTLEQSLGQHQAGKVLCEKALHIFEQVGDAAGVANASSNLAVIAYTEGDYRAARRLLARGLEEAQHTTGMREDDRAALETVASALALHDHRYQEALFAIQQAIDRWTRAYGAHYFMLVEGYLLRAEALASSGDRSAAVAEAKRALTLAKVVVGANTVGYLNAEVAYAKVLRICGEKEEAKRLSKEANGALAALDRSQCGGCTIDANGFR